MHMIVCDVEGCDATEKVNQGFGNSLPPGWKTVQMWTPPSKEEIAEVERQQEEIKAMMKDAPVGGGYMMPDVAEQLRVFTVCDKHEMPTMKVEASESPGFHPTMIARRRPKTLL